MDSPAPAEPPADEQAPSLADVLAPGEVGEGQALDDALTEADFEDADLEGARFAGAERRRNNL